MFLALVDDEIVAACESWERADTHAASTAWYRKGQDGRRHPTRVEEIPGSAEPPTSEGQATATAAEDTALPMTTMVGGQSRHFRRAASDNASRSPSRAS